MSLDPFPQRRRDDHIDEIDTGRLVAITSMSCRSRLSPPVPRARAGLDHLLTVTGNTGTFSKDSAGRFASNFLHSSPLNIRRSSITRSFPGLAVAPRGFRTNLQGRMHSAWQTRRHRAQKPRANLAPPSRPSRPRPLPKDNAAIAVAPTIGAFGYCPDMFLADLFPQVLSLNEPTNSPQDSNPKFSPR